MRIEESIRTAGDIESPTYTYTSPPEKISQSSIKSLTTQLSKPTFSLRVLMEDLFGFTMNLFLWPIHIRIILEQQLILLILLPILLPFIIISAFFEAILAIFNICACNYFDKILYGPKFASHEPSWAEMDALRPYVNHVATESISENEQVRLLHLINSYLDFSKEYSNHPRGIENSNFNTLIKVEVDGKSQLFQFKPSGNRAAVFEQYLNFLEQHATPSSVINHTFVGLDYSYLFGLLKMKVKTDVVTLQLGNRISRFLSLSFIGSFIPKFLFRQSLGKHAQESDQKVTDFSLWPGFTRGICTSLINKSLQGDYLNAYQISPLDFESIIRL